LKKPATKYYNGMTVQLKVGTQSTHSPGSGQARVNEERAHGRTDVMNNHSARAKRTLLLNVRNNYVNSTRMARVGEYDTTVVLQHGREYIPS